MVGVLDLDEGQPVDRGYFGFLDDQCSGLSSSLTGMGRWGEKTRYCTLRFQIYLYDASQRLQLTAST